jgi:hypothetical protein
MNQFKNQIKNQFKNQLKNQFKNQLKNQFLSKLCTLSLSMKMSQGKLLLLQFIHQGGRLV